MSDTHLANTINIVKGSIKDGKRPNLVWNKYSYDNSRYE